MKISIVTPSYNQSEFLESCIRSIINQNYDDTEYIVMDGGSDDGSVDIIQKYEGQIDFWRSEPDEGQPAAIEEGFQRATGDILCWVNSDDVLLPGALSAVAQAFEEHPQYGIVAGNSYRIDREGMVLTRQISIPVTFEALLLWWGASTVQPAYFWRRDLYEQVGGIDTSIRMPFDHELFLRMAHRSRVCAIDKFLAALREHDETKTATLGDIRAREHEELRRKYGYYDYNLLLRVGYRAAYALRYRLEAYSYAFRNGPCPDSLPDSQKIE
jgi:glycosyltransferase involved in cell wall biosynthesis